MVNSAIKIWVKLKRQGKALKQLFRNAIVHDIFKNMLERILENWITRPKHTLK